MEVLENIKLWYWVYYIDFANASGATSFKLPVDLADIHIVIKIVIEHLFFHEVHKSFAVRLYVNRRQLLRWCSRQCYFVSSLEHFAAVILLQIINDAYVINVVSTRALNCGTLLYSFNTLWHKLTLLEHECCLSIILTLWYSVFAPWRAFIFIITGERRVSCLTE